MSAAALAPDTARFVNNVAYSVTNSVGGGGSTGDLPMAVDASGADNTIPDSPAASVTPNFATYNSGLLTLGNFGGTSGTVNMLVGTAQFGVVGGAANTGGDSFGGGPTPDVASGPAFDSDGSAEDTGRPAGTARTPRRP